MFLAMVSTGSLIVTRIGQYYKKRALKLTKQIDADGDGFVTRAELKAQIYAHRCARLGKASVPVVVAPRLRTRNRWPARRRRETQDILYGVKRENSGLETATHDHEGACMWMRCAARERSWRSSTLGWGGSPSHVIRRHLPLLSFNFVTAWRRS